MTPLSAGYYDGQESTLAEADAAGYQTVQTDVTIFPAFYEPAILTMNSDLYDSLSPDLREAVDRCGREAMADQRLRNREQEAEILERWQGRGRHLRPCFDPRSSGAAFQALTDRLYDPEDPDPPRTGLRTVRRSGWSSFAPPEKISGKMKKGLAILTSV
ncbi:MAG: hypothetical protein ACLUIW_11880 [Dysosmobacter welbionis]